MIKHVEIENVKGFVLRGYLELPENAKKISYAKSYNLSRFDELDLGTQAIEDVAFNHTLEEAYKDL